MTIRAQGGWQAWPFGQARVRSWVESVAEERGPTQTVSLGERKLRTWRLVMGEGAGGSRR